jgi:putative membrane-bound dehydrogenase-like protein
VFAQSSDLVAPLGVLVVDERVYVSCSPSIFVYKDQNGDGDALDEGERQVFLTGFGGADHDHGVHALVRGPRGRLYFTVGNAGPHLVTDRGGWTLRSGSLYRDGGRVPADNKPGLVSDDGKVYSGGLILSVNFDASKLAVEAWNFRNPYDVAVDRYGELYTFDNDDEVAACRASWVLKGGSYGFFSADGSRTWRADQRPGQSIASAQWHQDDPGVVPGGTITGTGGPTGVHLYEEGALDAWLHGRLLAADAGRGAVFTFERVREGCGFRLEPRANLIASRAGREGESARWFRPSDVAQGPDGSLFIADWYDPGVGGHGMGDPRAHGRILRLAAREARTFEKVPDQRVDTRLVMLYGLRGKELAKAQNPLLALARWFDGQDRVYLEALALACEDKLEAAYAFLAKELGAEPWSESFAGIAWRLHPQSAIPAFVARALDPSLSLESRRQALDALAFMKTKEAADALANVAAAAAEDLRPTARWWLEQRATNDWSAWVDRDALGGRLADAELAWRSGSVRRGRQDVDLDLRGAKRLWLVVNEGEHGIDYDWADWLAPRFEGPSGTRRLVDLEWLSASAGWGAPRKGQNCDGGPLVVDGKTEADGIGTHARSEIAFAVPVDAERFRATAAPDDMGSLRAGSTNELEFQVWLERAPVEADLAGLAAQAFARDADPARRLEALRALAASPRGAHLVLRAREREELDERAATAVAEALFKNPDLGVRARASGLFQRPGERARPSLETLLALKGDPSAGRELFLDPRAQCATCHAFELGGHRRGGDIGPELTGVRAKFDAARLFDAILNPSAEIAHGFETWRVETKSGELHAGFLLADGPTLVVKDTQGKRHALAASDVVERTQERLSTMPDGIAAGLTDAELADLVAFLRDDPAREPEFGSELELFNGRDFSGWTHHLDDPTARFEDVWSVREGSLVCQGNPLGYLRTQATFTNFELTLEWRFDPARGPGNSGVLLRQIGPDHVWPKSIEAQLQHQNAGDIWNIEQFPMSVDLARTDGRHTARRAPCSEKPLGEWNRYRIRLDRGSLELEVNGVVQNSAAWCQEVPGAICLQSEGAWIEFRNVRLRPITN